jgi:hypothetical protein
MKLSHWLQHVSRGATNEHDNTIKSIEQEWRSAIRAQVDRLFKCVLYILEF